MVISAVLGGGSGTAYLASYLIPRVGRPVSQSLGRQATQDHSGDYALGPKVRLFDRLGSALATQPSYERLLAFSTSARLSLFNRTWQSNAALQALERIESAAEVLRREVKGLLDRQAFNVNQVLSDWPGVRAETTSEAEAGTYSLRVLQPARAHQIASDPVSDPNSPLGLEGQITLEGQAIRVSAEDTLTNLAARVNAAFKDRAQGVSAHIDSEGRLVLKRMAAGPFPIQLDEQGGVARALGLLAVDERGQVRIAHEQFAPQGARVEVNAEERYFDSNQISGLFPGLNLELVPELFPRSTDALGQAQEQPVEVTLRITRDIEGPRAAVLRLVELYNNLLHNVNAETLFGGSLEGDRALAAARARLIRAIEEPVPATGRDESPRTTRDIGLEVRHAPLREVSELTVRRLALLDDSGRPRSPLATATGQVSVIQNLGRIGIEQMNDGTLKVDQARLEQALREEPALVESVLEQEDQGVLPRLERQLDRLLDASSGILARRKRLFESWQEPVRVGQLDGKNCSYQELRHLQDQISLQQSQLESLLEGL